MFHAEVTTRAKSVNFGADEEVTWLSIGSQRVRHNWSDLAHNIITFSSVQFSCSVVSDSLWPCESQHARPPCPSPTLGVYPNSCPSNQWCHPVISSSVVPFSPAPNPSQHQSLFQWVNSSHEVTKYWSFSFSISLSNEHPGLISFRMEWLDLLAVQGTVQKHQFFSAQLSSQSNSHIHTGPLEKP